MNTGPPFSLPRMTAMVAWSQAFLREVLSSGDIAVDLTAGAGRDTLFLWRQVAPEGKILTFDIQEESLARTRALLDQADVPIHWLTPNNSALPAAGVYAVAACHSRLEDFLPAPPRAVIANLGFLPGGNSAVITRSETTIRALEASGRVLCRGGRLAVVAYPGHSGGREEEREVAAWFGGLPAATWSVLKLAAVNRPDAPTVLVAERRQ
jgi:hypothetical protein